MVLRDYIAALRRQWVVIAAVCLVTVGAAAIVTMRQEPVYQARAQLFVSSGGSDDSISQVYQGGLFVQQRIRSYLQVATSPAVLEPAAEDLEWEGNPAALAGRISAESPPETVLITIAATSDEPQEAAAIANTVATNFATYVEALESRDTQDVDPVKVSVTKPAVAPGVPVSPRPMTNLLFAAVAGLALGVGVASVRELLDTALRTEEQVTAIAKAPVIGRVAFDRDAGARPVALMSGSSARSEAFRVLRTNLQYVDVEKPARCVVITSSVPGEGKTTTSVNLAGTVAQTGQRVMLVECDLRRPRGIEMLGLVAGVGLTDVLVGRAGLADVVQALPDLGVDVLGSGPIPPNPSELLASPTMKRVLGELSNEYDLVILDAPPLMPVTDAAVLARAVDGAILVVRHGKTTREQLSGATAALEAVDARVLGVVLNMVPLRSSGYGYDYYGSRDAKDRSKPVTKQSNHGKIPASDADASGEPRLQARHG